MSHYTIFRKFTGQKLFLIVFLLFAALGSLSIETASANEFQNYWKCNARFGNYTTDFERAVSLNHGATITEACELACRALYEARAADRTYIGFQLYPSTSVQQGYCELAPRFPGDTNTAYTAQSTRPQCPAATTGNTSYDLPGCGCSNPQTKSLFTPFTAGDPEGCAAIDAANKNSGTPCGVGNPCNPATGNKFQAETDFTQGIAFTRSYNSENLADLGLGRGWRSNHQQKLVVGTDALTQVSGTGRGEPWEKAAGVWRGDDDSDVVITETATGFQLARANGSITDYDAAGSIVSETSTNGHQTGFSYNSAGQLMSVTNHYGHSLNFSYLNGRLASVTDVLGAVYEYGYDANDNLVSVIYPDATPSDALDNPRRVYHYENVDFPNHLTGITDENGSRFATYSYDAQGKAISTEHSQTTNLVGQERFELEYQTEVPQ